MHCTHTTAHSMTLSSILTAWLKPGLSTWLKSLTKRLTESTLVWLELLTVSCTGERSRIFSVCLFVCLLFVVCCFRCLLFVVSCLLFVVCCLLLLLLLLLLFLFSAVFCLKRLFWLRFVLCFYFLLWLKQTSTSYVVSSLPCIPQESKRMDRGLASRKGF